MVDLPFPFLTKTQLAAIDSQFKNIYITYREISEYFIVYFYTLWFYISSNVSDECFYHTFTGFLSIIPLHTFTVNFFVIFQFFSKKIVKPTPSQYEAT